MGGSGPCGSARPHRMLDSYTCSLATCRVDISSIQPSSHSLCGSEFCIQKVKSQHTNAGMPDLRRQCWDPEGHQMQGAPAPASTGERAATRRPGPGSHRGVPPHVLPQPAPTRTQSPPCDLLGTPLRTPPSPHTGECKYPFREAIQESEESATRLQLQRLQRALL